MRYEGETMKKIEEDASLEIDKEFEGAVEEVQQRPHGPVMGATELYKLGKAHPLLLFFFEYFGAGVEPETQQRVAALGEHLLKEKATEKEIRDFTEKYVHPFYQDFFERAQQELNLTADEEKELLELEGQYHEKKHKLSPPEFEKLGGFMSRFYQKLVGEQESKKAV